MSPPIAVVFLQRGKLQRGKLDGIPSLDIPAVEGTKGERVRFLVQILVFKYRGVGPGGGDLARSTEG